MAALPEDETHRCGWRERAEALEAENQELQAALSRLSSRVEALTHELEVLKRRVLGPSSEKMPNVLADEVPAPKVDFEAVLKKRRERAKAKLKLQTVVRHHSVPEAERRCPKCGGTD